MAAQTYVNGKIFTGRSEDDFVSAMRVEGGRIAGIGDVDDVETGDTVDLRGRTVLPGFLDVHTHPMYVARTVEAVACTPPHVRDIDGMVERLRSSAKVGMGDDVWIEGWGYDESQLAEHRPPTAADLDSVSTTQPVYVMRSDCHSGAANSRALELAGVTRDRPDPPGGRIGRDADGHPNGLLLEVAANEIVLNAKDGGRSLPHDVDLLASAADHFNRRGIVAVTDMMAAPGPIDYIDLYRGAAEKGLAQQAVIYYSWANLRELAMGDLAPADRRGRTRVGGLKLFVDGTISGRTAWTSDPYPGSPDQHGLRTASDDDIESAYAYARRNGLQLVFHAMGDRAIQTVIDAFRDRAPWVEDGPSVRIDHATLISPSQMRQMRAATMSFGIATQIIFLFAEYESYVSNLSAERFQSAYPLRALYRECDDLALSSDAPATTWADPDDVFVSLQAAVTRRSHRGHTIGDEHRITVPQAVLLYTAKASRVARLRDLGRIEPGSEASFVVLNRDVFTVPVEEINQIRVEQTFIRGIRVHPRG